MDKGMGRDGKGLGKGTKRKRKLTNPRMLSKTRDYLDHFARFKRKENVEAVERLLSAHKELAKFERAQLGSISLFSAPLSSQPAILQIHKQQQLELELELEVEEEV